MASSVPAIPTGTKGALPRRQPGGPVEQALDHGTVASGALREDNQRLPVGQDRLGHPQRTPVGGAAIDLEPTHHINKRSKRGVRPQRLLGHPPHPATGDHGG